MSTIKDVARRTGLSLSTISKYLNGGNVREENRLAIDAAIEELDYSVNVFARSLKANRSMTIGVLLPTISSPFFGRVVAAMEPVLHRRHDAPEERAGECPLYTSPSPRDRTKTRMPSSD